MADVADTQHDPDQAPEVEWDDAKVLVVLGNVPKEQDRGPGVNAVPRPAPERRKKKKQRLAVLKVRVRQEKHLKIRPWRSGGLEMAGWFCDLISSPCEGVFSRGMGVKAPRKMVIRRIEAAAAMQLQPRQRADRAAPQMPG